MNKTDDREFVNKVTQDVIRLSVKISIEFYERRKEQQKLTNNQEEYLQKLYLLALERL